MPKTTAAAALLAAVLAGPVSGLPSESERETGRESPKDDLAQTRSDGYRRRGSALRASFFNFSIFAATGSGPPTLKRK